MVSKDKEQELIETIKGMIKDGEKEEDIIMLFTGLGLEEDYIKQLIEKAKSNDDVKINENTTNLENLENIIYQPSKNTIFTERPNKTQKIQKDTKQKTLHESITLSDQEILERLERLEKKVDIILEKINDVKEDTTSSKAILEKIMVLYKKIINKLISKYS